MIGDEAPLILMILETHPMEGHVDTIPWIPYHPTLWTSYGNLVDVLCDASLQANSGHRHRFQQALRRHAHQEVSCQTLTLTQTQMMMTHHV